MIKVDAIFAHKLRIRIPQPIAKKKTAENETHNFSGVLAPSQRVTFRLTLMLAMTMTGVACIHDFCWLLVLLPLFCLGICIFKKIHIGQRIYIVNIKINFVVGKHQR